MNRNLRKIFILLLTVLMIPGSVYAGMLDLEEDWLPERPEWVPEFSQSHAFMTKYIWRGWNLGDEPVWQMDNSLSKWGFTFDIWTNYTFNKDKTKDGGIYQEFTEVDYSIDYTFNFGEMSELVNIDCPEFLSPLGASLGYIYYTFPNLDWGDKFFDTHEIYLGCSYDVILQPSFTWYWDVGRGKGNTDGGGDGSYFLFGIGHTFDFAETGISADLGMTVGIIDEQWTNKRGWADMAFTGGINIPFLNHFTVTPSVAYSLILDRSTYNDEAENEFYGGLTLSFSY